MAEMLTRRFILHGKVQGVGCRAQVHEWALSIGSMSGYVKNLPDGRVEVCAHGQSWRVNDLEKALREKLLFPVEIEFVETTVLQEIEWPPGFVIRRS